MEAKTLREIYGENHPEVLHGKPEVTEQLRGLVEQIPKALETFAKEAWGIGEDSELEFFRSFIEGTIGRTQAGGGSYCKVYKGQFKEYGFASYPDLKNKIHQLRRAWQGLIDIKIINGGASKIELLFSATEYAP